VERNVKKRVGVLYSGGNAEEKPSVFHAMYSFMNGLKFADDYGYSYMPRYLIQYDEVNKVWEKLQPTREELRECNQASMVWHQHNQFERDLRE
jgi:hypothetical protein